MSESLVCFNAAFFILMGLVGLIRPVAITSPFALVSLPVDMKNEVRAVYGGFGVAVAGLLLAALIAEPIRLGVLVTVAVALLGMATGRVISFGVDRSAGRYPVVFLFVELGLAGSLFAAAFMGTS